MSSKKLIVNAVPLVEFFRDIVQRAIVNLNMDPSDDVEFYIVNLLEEFSQSDKLFERDEDSLTEKPLALLLERAIHSDHETRIKTLKYIGDVSLYFAGYFPQRVNSKVVDLDYYVSMGGGAYLTLAQRMSKPNIFGDIFEEIGCEFDRFVNLLTEVNMISTQKSNNDLIKLYEQWLETGDERIRDILEREGIKPQAVAVNEQ